MQKVQKWFLKLVVLVCFICTCGCCSITSLALSNNADLSSISLSSGATIQISNPSKLAGYTATVPYATSSISITATASDANAKVTQVSNKSLNVGDNFIPVTVTSANGTAKKIYIVKIHRQSNDTSLKSIMLSNGESTNLANGSPFNATVDSTTNNITATPHTTDPNATSAVTGGNNLNFGNNQNAITIVVTAEDTSYTNTYYLNIYKESDNANLSYLDVNDGKGAQLSNLYGYTSDTFDGNLTSYYLPIAQGSTSVTISETLADSAHATDAISLDANSENAGVSYDEQTGEISGLQPGNDTIVTITVTAEDTNITKDYIIDINCPAAVLSSDCSLSSISFSASGTLNPTPFDPNTNNYTYTVVNATNSMTITPTTNDANATYVLNGDSSNLQVGDNSISIVVTAQDGTINTYTLNIYRMSNDATLSGITVNGTAIPSFSPATNVYTLDNVDNSITSVDVGATQAESHQSISGMGTSNLQVGDNAINIVVTAEDGTTNTYTLNIHRNALIPVTGVSLDATNISMKVGGQMLLTATVTPSEAHQQITWSVQSGSDYAAVDSNGVITGNGVGTAVIRAASAQDPTQYVDITVNIVKCFC